MFEEILNVPESAALLKVSDLLDEVNAAKAACEQKEAELQSLREETAELVAAKLAKAGADEAFVQAAKAMWVKDPQSTLQAIAGDSVKNTIVGEFVQSARGCNQYKHKPGCPEAEGGNDYEAEKSKKAKEKEAEIEYTLKNKDVIRKNYEKIQQEKFDIEDEFMRYSNLIKTHESYGGLDDEEEKFVKELKEKRKKWFEKLKVAERRLDDETQKLRDTGLWGYL